MPATTAPKIDKPVAPSAPVAQPATALPWEASGPQGPHYDAALIGEAGQMTYFAKVLFTGDQNAPTQDAAYIVEACNAYPRLLAERAQLVAFVRRVAIVGGDRPYQDAARLLESLGEGK